METKGSFCGLGNNCKPMRLVQWCEGKNRPRYSMKFLILLISVLFIFSSVNPAFLRGENIKFLEKIKLYGEPEPLQNPWAFCVTDDGLTIIPDFKAGNIKIYERTGEFLRFIGRKGYGKDEFSKPTYCYYDKIGKFVVLDHGLRKIFIYDQIDRIYFERVGEVSCWRAADDIQLSGDKFFFSGYKADTNQERYEFYYIDLTDNQITFLLPSYLKYGLKSPGEHEAQFLGGLNIPKIGIRGWFDIYRDSAFYTWEGNLKIIKLNIVSGEIDPDTFGIQPPHYVKPYASSKLIEAFKDRNIKSIEAERAKMSYVRHIFAGDKYVFVIYEGVVVQENVSNFRVQFYTLEGEFIIEKPIPAQPDRKMWYDRDNHFLYSLAKKPGGDEESGYIIKYKIEE